MRLLRCYHVQSEGFNLLPFIETACIDYGTNGLHIQKHLASEVPTVLITPGTIKITLLIWSLY